MKASMRFGCLFGFLLFALPALAGAQVGRERLAGADRFIESVMKEWKIPGLAVAAIQEGQVLLLKGYGYRDVEKQLPVTAATLFAIGSNTKSFTVTVLGMLNDEGKLDWDKPVREYLPDFRLQDPTAAEQMTPRDLVTHRSGLPRHDLLWLASGLGRRQLYERLRFLQPSKPFRSTYQYQNLMFMTAGYLAEQLTGRAWEDLVRARILEPLGMARANFSVRALEGDPDSALAYAEEKGRVVRVPYRNIDAIGPAGSINSSVEEMVRYLRFHIDLGKLGDKQLLSEKNARMMQTPQMVQPSTDEYPEIGPASYGMGLMVATYRGRKLVSHGGGIDGFVSAMSWLPNDKIGIMVLTNLGGNNPVPNLVTRYLMDCLLGLEPVDWPARVREQQKKQEKAREEAARKAAAERKAGTSFSHALSDYTGRYEHPAYGVAEVTSREGQLAVRVAGFEVPLEHFHYDVFAVPQGLSGPLAGFARSRIMFLYDKKGDIDRVLIPLEPNADDIVFTRVRAQ